MSRAEITTTYDSTGRRVTVRLYGTLSVPSAAHVHTVFQTLERNHHLEEVFVDFASVEALDSAGVAAVCLGINALRGAGKRASMRNLTPQQQKAIELVPTKELGPPAVIRPSWLEHVGDVAVRVGQTGAGLLRLVVQTTRMAGRCLGRSERFPWATTVEQSVYIGIDAITIVAMLSFLLGLILGFQSAYQLQFFGAQVYMADIVGVGVVREFGPLITAIIVAGRSGAAIAAELGTMVVREETDALRVMGVSPVRFLVLPRVAAITLVQPVLTLLSMAIGIIGGISIAGRVGLSPWHVFGRMQDALAPPDFALGLLKSILFAWTIGLVGCHMGLTTTGGATSVGRSTTQAVVTSIFLIIVIDSIVTTVWTLAPT